MRWPIGVPVSALARVLVAGMPMRKASPLAVAAVAVAAAVVVVVVVAAAAVVVAAVVAAVVVVIVAADPGLPEFRSALSRSP